MRISTKPAANPIKDRPPLRFEAGHRSDQKPAFSAMKLTPWVSNFGIKYLTMNEGILMPEKRRLTETFATNAVACSKRNQLA
ncbi:hypothetical protein [Rhizobium ruizarguesonis]|uniref:hypothetical protein n=1 Tax=Rhizobium ruizarguesonis TaxID=2081791 RepID=UPI0013EEA101|nr:hypothetical protein [Rhizobium ruizarguesonis]